MVLEIKNTIDDLKWEEIQEVYQSVGWNKHTIEIIQTVFKNSNEVCIIKTEGKIVGIGRALSDGVFNAAIYDIVVHRDFQKLGIAKEIIHYFIERFKNVSCVHLISTTGNEGFYEKMGFKKTKTGMARYLNSSLSNEYLVD
ncbi:GNAT family N-acetyltransferase [Heyndrickxia oleronia]|uniref:GNAT family N-acetyltransferase n=1 Tax=Heyndrickxia oleronia TaxID=38875 RepID=A0A8E2LD90_9BACI|nr:GNAT family N-acetyltransferase [Heyndrickxia oleronia]NYV65553.1 GNAT family N-acetyltransferase [Bacillus sp. Gen3]OJH20519.1 GNAT family N-acetyltransferase [Bacillus obstructivus]MBU5210203.1 GNAT family N-acetyltransferase [Heyndrickxia oleronia]MEC1376518.1 GNAT family N-acetyltransferase [Heyndrickxia oleronia]OOP66019.1 GNAT family N-acetyltransferase [Heyndrickxia oleronia]